MSLLETVKRKSQEFAGEVVAIRRNLHANPELSYKEFNTAKLVTEQLKSFGLQPQSVASTGVVAIVEGKSPSRKLIALRADLDALPIQELNKTTYASKNP